MKLDYHCPLYITQDGSPVTSPDALATLDGYVDMEEGSDFTEFMEPDDSEGLTGEKMQVVIHDGQPYARVGFHVEDALSPERREELDDYVLGQFMDGYGSHPVEVRTDEGEFTVHFATDMLTVQILDYKTQAFAPFSGEGQHVLENSFITGPHG